MSSTLYKFCDVSTALAFLENGSLRWQSPDCYHDPFELHAFSSLPFDRQTFKSALCREVIAQIFASSDADGSGPLVAAIKRWREEQRFDNEEEAEPVLNELLQPICDQNMERIEQHYNAWQDFAARIRICCFSSNPGAFSCWQHYADNHRGVALRFESQSANVFANPYQVNYGDIPPRLTSLEQELDIAFGRAREQFHRDMFFDLLNSKNRALKEEKEWRCLYQVDSDQQAEDGDSEQKHPPQARSLVERPFAAEDFSAIIFGLSCSEEDKARCIELCQQRYHTTRLFQTVRSDDRYTLEFSRIRPDDDDQASRASPQSSN